MIDIKTASNFGGLLAQMIENGDTTAVEVAKIMGCRRNMIPKYVKQGNRPSADKLNRFADRFGLDRGELLKLTYGGVEVGNGRNEFNVRTERGAIVGRTFENLPNDQVRSAVYELLMSLNRDIRKSGTQ